MGHFGVNETLKILKEHFHCPKKESFQSFVKDAMFARMPSLKSYTIACTHISQFLTFLRKIFRPILFLNFYDRRDVTPSLWL